MENKRDSLVHVFVFKKALENPEGFLLEINKALSEWKSHGVNVIYEVEILYHQILVIHACQNSFKISGCSKDQLREIVLFQLNLNGIGLMDSSVFLFLVDKIVVGLPFEELSRLRDLTNDLEGVKVIQQGVQSFDDFTKNNTISFKDTFFYQRLGERIIDKSNNFED